MADATYDAVIIGAGHNGMALATYLARSGLSVAVFERRAEEGGGLTTEESTRPGFLHNLHSNYHSLVGVSPVYDDLELFEEELQYVQPPVQMGSVFNDGTALTTHTDLDKTCASIARFSQKDADTWHRLYTEVKGFLDLLVGTLMFAPPISLNEITRALNAWSIEDKSEFLSSKLRTISINQFLDKHFENPRIKAHLAFYAAICAYTTDYVGLASSFPLLLGKIDNWHCCIGGSHNLAHALWRRCTRAGGLVFPQYEVVEIIVDQGRALGVKLADGSEIEATQFVASSIDVEQTFGRLIDPAHLPAEFIRKLDAVEHQEWTLFSVHLAMNEAPKYESASFDPDINNAWIINAGYETPQDLVEHWNIIRKGGLPDPKPNCAVNSLFDPTDAPEGKFTGLIRQFAPYSPAGEGPDKWDELKHDYTKACIEKWIKYAPNLAGGAIIEAAPYTPADITRKMINFVVGDWMMGKIIPDNMLDKRPLPELAQYRTPIGRLYMCGSTQHPHGYITFAPAYNALQIIAEDLGLTTWWKKI